MFRVTIEVVPDHRQRDKTPGRIIRRIDIKEDGSGSYREGNYKSRFYIKPFAEADWRSKQVMGVKYSDLVPERLLRDVLNEWLKDRDAEILSMAGSAEYTRSRDVT